MRHELAARVGESNVAADLLEHGHAGRPFQAGQLLGDGRRRVPE